MHQPLQPIIQHLFQVSTLEDVSRERLESFVEEYPSFGIGHYLLSRKLRAEDPDRFQAETQRTCLYFSNPFWLQWLLENTEDAGARKETVDATDTWQSGSSVAAAVESEPATVLEPTAAFEPATTTLEEPIALEPVYPAAETESLPVENVVTMAEEAYDAAPVEPVQPMAEETVIGHELATSHELSAGHEPPAGHEQSIVHELPIGDNQSVDNDQSVGDDLAEALTSSEPEEVTVIEREAVHSGEGENLEGQPEPEASAPAAIQEESSAADLLLRSIEEARVLRESLHKINDNFETPGASTEEPIRDEEAPFVLPETEEKPAESAAIEDHQQPVEHHAPAESIAIEAHQPANPVGEQPPTLAADQTASPARGAAPAEPVFTFEPFHTIDYFASQGIKLTLEENPADALGKQLKSFTDWLKGMRRLPQKDKEVVPDRVAEQAVQAIAAHSIEGKEVLTETMAEVLAKQGMREKARAVYEKLSLLNPGKSAYFAAKIEQLNIR